jgi:hypothetical protein
MMNTPVITPKSIQNVFLGTPQIGARVDFVAANSAPSGAAAAAVGATN